MVSELARAAPPSPPSAPSADVLPTLEELYDRYADFVYRTLVSLRLTPEAAEDAMQEVFLVAHRRLPEFQGTFFKAWLFRIATSIAQNSRRLWARRSKRSVDVDLETLADPRQNEPFEKVAHSERVRLLQALLERLDDREREAFILVELEQVSHQEAAQALEVHVNTVANRLRAARLGLDKLISAHQAQVRGRRG